MVFFYVEIQKGLEEMDKLLASEWVSIITALGVLAALLTNIRNWAKGNKEEAESMAEMRSDIKYIKEKLERMDNIPERMVAVEESTKQAHKWLDRLEGR